MVGKTTGSLIDAHYLLVDDPRYLLGEFNAHLAQRIFLQADKAFWSGDDSGVGRLKSPITSDTQMLEHKGVDPIRVSNYSRLMITSNEDCAVPAGLDDRRWLSIDVGQERRQDGAYFEQLHDHFFAGEKGARNRAALLWELLHHPLDMARLRSPPRTQALFGHKMRTLGPVYVFWLDRLTEGATLPGMGWLEVVPKARLRGAYDASCDRIGQRHKGGDREFSIALRKLVPELSTTKCEVSVGSEQMDNADQRRVHAFRFPPLETCRTYFEELMGQPIMWGETTA